MTILIKNGLVYDGTGNAPVKSDVLIQNKRVVQLGTHNKKAADLTIDAAGATVTPGLVDINFNAKGRAGILANPSQENSILSGITTVIGGGGGTSLAPILGNSLTFIKEWGSAISTNLHWRSVGEFLEVLGKRGVGVNFGTLVGYLVIRNFFTGGVPRDLTLREMESVKHAVGQALKDGAFGVSVDLSAPNAQRIPTREIVEITREAAAAKRVVSISLRHEDEGLIAALQEILEVGKATGASIEINRLQPLRDLAALYEEALNIIEKETAQSYVGFDVLPEAVKILPIYSLLPPWLTTGDMAEMARTLNEKGIKERVLKHFQKMKMDDLVIAEAPQGLKFLEGKTLEDFAKNHGMSKARALFKLMTLTNLRAKVLSTRVDKKIFEEFLANQRSIVSASSDHRAGKLGNGGDFFAWAEKSGKLPLEKAVAKMTGLAAVKYGIPKRGFVKEGFWADMVVWEGWKPKAVIVNGSPAMMDGICKKKMAGSILKAR
ncbi:MAG: hypothetical protein ABSF47_04015 [Minisyncoccia bacterium]|jgi:N-acyl-D-amino-acid deacylase